MHQYFNLIRHIQLNGIEKTDRTGTGTKSIFGYQMRFNLDDGFPLVTTKKIHMKSVIHELLWFIKGETNIEYLQKNGVRIWNEWADEKGNLGPVYGHQWRNWNSQGIDQLKDMINTINSNPNSRRIIVNAWNPGVLPNTSISFSANVANNKAALPPCHTFFQCYLADGKLSLQLYQRSADVFLGVPFNIASYALLNLMLAQVTENKPGEFIHTFGDAHIYSNHKKQINEQLLRVPKKLPKVILNPEIKNIFDFTYDDIEIVNYDPHPLIKGSVSI